MNSYEIILLFDSNLGEEKIGGIVSKIEGKIGSLGGELEKTDKWGVRNLPLRLQKARKLTQAYYVALFFKGESALPGKIQAYLKVTENIIRYSVMRAVPKAEPEIAAAPEAVNVGEIKGAEEALGES